ncbi:Reticulocyte-binding protein 2 a [Tetrabaena socialis]|uniref:Reticulocyte-binding protein 2 a n=1 Tax=Tetrabaena socialis TaxID=47790 RepID=A0A2J8ADE6_9CHLO|nr:Reticulocyte-binding protein 2 a [Tetrabaena socialis]|eukprot:PNH10537.1 Reticulocyte-binding protein 2 a [Tetrabaena socialis]
MSSQGFTEAQVDAVEAIICQSLNFDPNDKRLLHYKRDKIREKAKRLGSKREAEEAKKEAEESKKEAEEAKKEAEESKKEAEEAKREAEESKKEAEEAKKEAEESKREAEEAKKEAEESKKEAEEAKKEAEESKKEAEESKREAEESKKEAEESNAVAGAKEAELAKIRTKIYEELPKLDHVYVSKEVVAPQWRLAIGQAELASDAHKVGKAVDPRKREAQLNTGSAQGARVIYTCATHNAKIIEDIVKVAQRRYHIASIGGCEHYNNAVEHSVDVIDIATTVVDTLASSFEYMKRGVLFRKVIGNLEDVWGVENEEDNEDKDKEKDKEKDKGKGKDKDPPAAIAGEANPLKDWLDTTVIVTGNSSDVLLIADLKGTCHIRDKRFAEYVEEYFRGVRGVTFHAVNSVKVGETWATKRGVLKGVQLQ